MILATVLICSEFLLFISLYVLITYSEVFKNIDATHHVKEENSFPNAHFMLDRQS